MFAAKIILDSISPCGKRLTTVEATYPRFIHCFSDDTEVLVKYNNNIKFMLFSEAMHLDLEVATYKDGYIWFEKPIAWIKKQSNEIINISNGQFSTSITPEHRMYIGTRKDKNDNKWSKWNIVTAENLMNNYHSFAVKKAGLLLGQINTIDINMAKLIGFFIGDGTLPRFGKQTIFHLKKQRKIEYLHALLNKLNIAFSYRKYSDGTSNTVFDRFELLSSCYNQLGEKKIPNIFFNQSTDVINALFDGLRNSDGSTKENGLWEFNTFSEELANQMQILGILNNKVINLKKYIGPDKSICWKFRIVRNNYTVIRKDRSNITKTNYNRNVYCCTVSSSLLVVRHNNISHISGNCELMTHRMFSRNAASSRAIKIEKIIKMVEDNPAMPIHWGANQAGMQASKEIDNKDEARAKWLAARDAAVKVAKEMQELKMHKQVVNRILEPFMWMTTLISATEWDNFFLLRRHADAQPEIHYIADLIYDAIKNSSAVERQYHIPYIDGIDELRFMGDFRTLFKISAARCARLSYLTQNGDRDTSADLKLYQRLIDGSDGIGHLSPFEHQAIALNSKLSSGNFIGWEQHRKIIECAR